MKKILIADDDESIQMLFVDELTEDGYDVITTGDGIRLIEMIETEKPDLVIMDVRLGNYNGLDLLQDIRNTHNNLPVILCTAYPAFKYDLKSIAADYYAIKSSDLSELKSIIIITLEGGRSLPSSVYKKKVQRSESMRMGRTKVN